MSPKKPRFRKPSEGEWIESFHEALCYIEDHVLPLADEEFIDSTEHQLAARGAFEQIRTAAQHLSRKTLGRMPEVVADQVAETRNTAVYEYPVTNSHLILAMLRRNAEGWRAGIDRVRGQTRDGQPLTPVPSRNDGSLQRSRRPRFCMKPSSLLAGARASCSRGTVDTAVPRSRTAPTAHSDSWQAVAECSCCWHGGVT